MDHSVEEPSAKLGFLALIILLYCNERKEEHIGL
jgi:hypothetical protein